MEILTLPLQGNTPDVFKKATQAAKKGVMEKAPLLVKESEADPGEEPCAYTQGAAQSCELTNPDKQHPADS